MSGMVLASRGTRDRSISTKFHEQPRVNDGKMLDSVGLPNYTDPINRGVTRCNRYSRLTLAPERLSVLRALGLLRNWAKAARAPSDSAESAKDKLVRVPASDGSARSSDRAT